MDYINATHWQVNIIFSSEDNIIHILAAWSAIKIHSDTGTIGGNYIRLLAHD